MGSQEQAFVDAQRRLLDAHGVDAISGFVDVAAVGRAHVLTCGAGPDVVMLNGIGTPAAMWAPLMAELSGFTLHAVDLPAYGLTDAPADFTRALRANAVRFLEQVLDALRLARPPFVANSLGGLWSCWLALDRPDRVAALVLAGCPAIALGSTAPMPMRLLCVRPLGRLLTAIQPPSPRQVEQLSRMVRQHPMEPAVAELLEATERLPSFRRTFLETLHRLVRLRGPRPGMELTAEQLARIGAPAQVFWGDVEPFAPRETGQRLATLIPDASFHLVRGGHAPWLTDAPAIGPPAREFLRIHAAGAT